MDPVARDPAQKAVHRRLDGKAVESAEQIIPENPSAYVERRPPDAVARRIDEALLADAAEHARDAV